MTELKTLKVKERFINSNVFNYLWLANTLQKIRENVLFVIKNINPQMEEVKPVQKNVGIKEKDNMIKNILNKIQRFQDNLQRIGKRRIGKKLMKEQKRDGEMIKDYELEINQMNFLEKKEFQDRGNVNFVEKCPTDKFIILNIQGRILF
jgi:hypothetical protein